MKSPDLDRGRDAFRRMAWREAYAWLSAADAAAPLGPEDLERLARAAFLLGRDDAPAITERAHREALRHGDHAHAANSAFWLGMALLDRREYAKANAWFARAERIVDDTGLDTVERGYLLLPRALEHAMEGDQEAAVRAYDQALALAQRFGDSDLATLARLGQGEARIALGEIRTGLAALDDVMLAVTSGEVSSIVAGIAYCSAIESFQAIFDLRRAQEWTAALTRWCEAQPDLVPFRGLCRLERAHLMQLRGDWRAADDEARQAQAWFSGTWPEDPAIGEALHRQGDLHRLQGRFSEAEAAYRDACRYGRQAEPGLAQLRLARGDVGAAMTSIRRALAEAAEPARRSRLLEPAVDIALAADDLESARGWSEELGGLAARLGAQWLDAMAARAAGAVRLASGDAAGAIGTLRSAWSTWQGLGVPYEAARVRVLIARASRALGDEYAAAMEIDAARQSFLELGATPDVTALDAAVAALRPPGGLTAREVEVLRLVASGRTNRAIASDLVLSEKTVARHVANIFTKLDLSTRAAATAYAYEHGLIETQR
jgi:DNA-binding CsgD family transcriptional regulator